MGREGLRSKGVVKDCAASDGNKDSRQLMRFDLSLEGPGLHGSAHNESDGKMGTTAALQPPEAMVVPSSQGQFVSMAANGPLSVPSVRFYPSQNHDACMALSQQCFPVQALIPKFTNFFF